MPERFLLSTIYCLVTKRRRTELIAAAVRGEAANHGIMDVAILLDKILPALSSSDDSDALVEAVREYTEEMITRTRPAVLNSRQACLDAHEYKAINDDSPLIKRRIAVAET